MSKSGPRDDGIDLLDNQPLFANQQKLIISHSGRQMIPSYTVLFTAHSIEILKGGGQRTKDLQLQSQAVTMWDMKSGL